MKSKAGRPAEPFQTMQIRIDTGSAELLRRLAGVSGKSLGAYGHEELVPILRELLAKKLKAASSELAKETKGNV